MEIKILHFSKKFLSGGISRSFAISLIIGSTISLFGTIFCGYLILSNIIANGYRYNDILGVLPVGGLAIITIILYYMSLTLYFEIDDNYVKKRFYNRLYCDILPILLSIREKNINPNKKIAVISFIDRIPHKDIDIIILWDDFLIADKINNATKDCTIIETHPLEIEISLINGNTLHFKGDEADLYYLIHLLKRKQGKRYSKIPIYLTEFYKGKLTYEEYCKLIMKCK